MARGIPRDEPNAKDDVAEIAHDQPDPDYEEPDVYSEDQWERWEVPDPPAIRVGLRAVSRTIGGFLYHHRRRRRMRQGDTARVLGVDQSRVSRLERGDAEPPTIATLCRIVSATGARIDLAIEPMPAPSSRVTPGRRASDAPRPITVTGPHAAVAAHDGARIVVQVTPVEGPSRREFS
ncbi:MAG: helix-turn-helix domain-containing protein [Solirubrobacteraceae bacterium]